MKEHTIQLSYSPYQIRCEYYKHNNAKQWASLTYIAPKWKSHPDLSVTHLTHRGLVTYKCTSKTRAQFVQNYWLVACSTLFVVMVQLADVLLCDCLFCFCYGVVSCAIVEDKHNRSEEPRYRNDTYAFKPHRMTEMKSCIYDVNAVRAIIDVLLKYLISSLSFPFVESADIVMIVYFQNLIA